MQKITPCIWLDNNAEELVNFYKSVFQNVKVGLTSHYDAATAAATGNKAGGVLVIEFEIEGFGFMALNGGPIFKITPAVSFSVHCKDPAEVDELWNKLIVGGEALMEVGEYPFSKRYGWLKDKFGVTWQLNAAPRDQKISASLMYTQEQAGKAEEAINLYISLFPNSQIKEIHRYQAGESPIAADTGTINHSVWTLEGQEFIAMDSAQQHMFGFTEGISLSVDCDSQEEIDKYWNALSAHPEAEQCGWLKDKYGLSWQISPRFMREATAEGSERTKRVMAAMMPMKKLDYAKLKEAYDG